LRREEAVPPAACASGERSEGPLFSLRHPVSGALPSLRKALKRIPANRGLRGLLHRLQHAFDLLTNLAPRRGFIITFSGVDDAGQRMVIEATRHRIRQELQAPVIVLPHQPRLASLLALARRTQREAAGRSMNPGSAAESGRGLWALPLLRRVEGLLVQAYVLFRYVLRGYVVLYDHYFDCRESGNSQVHLPGVLTSWWYRFLVKPDLNFLLYAPAEVIRQRSQELSTEDIERLTGEYLALFNKLERRSGHGDFIPVRNTRLGDTLETLFRHIHTRQASI
jgi:thymidylate kinase